MLRIKILLVSSILFTASTAWSQSLMIDIDDRGASDPANTAPDFEQFLIGGNENDDNSEATTRTFGSIDVTINHSNGGGYGDRRRAEPTNGGDFTDQELLRDFTFARGTTPDDGLDILIESLTPGVDHNITIWSFDNGSQPTRTSDWFANGELVQDDYMFNGTELPTDNASNSFGFVAAADGDGKILIEGRYVDGACCAVFLNAMSVEVVPEPSSAFLAVLGTLGLLSVRRRARRS